MTDVVVTLPVRAGAESQLFGEYFNAFTESRSSEADLAADDSDAPYLMMRSQPGDGEEIKVLIFQERSAASAFSSGWARACGQGGKAARG